MFVEVFKKTVILLLILELVQTMGLMARFKIDPICRPPRGDTCLEIRQCAQFAALLNRTTIPRPRHVIQLMRERQCGFVGNTPKVCCTTLSLIPATATVNTVVRTTTVQSTLVGSSQATPLSLLVNNNQPGLKKSPLGEAEKVKSQLGEAQKVKSYEEQEQQDQQENSSGNQQNKHLEQQNTLLEQQNKHLVQQNKHLEQQSYGDQQNPHLAKEQFIDEDKFVDERQPPVTVITASVSSGGRKVATQVYVAPPDVKSHRNRYLLPMRSCGPITSGYRITSGVSTALGEFPWMALIAYDTEDGIDFRCAGTLINSRYVLTAAHCVQNMTVIGVRLGEHNINTVVDCDVTKTNCAPPIQDYYVEDIVAHPDYIASSFANDVALIRLAEPANLSLANIKPICLPVGELTNLDLDGKFAIISGWGVTESGFKSAVLLKTLVPVVPTAACNAIYQRYANITHRQICAGGYRGRDSCGGDSGGPIKYVSLVEDADYDYNYENKRNRRNKRNPRNKRNSGESRDSEESRDREGGGDRATGNGDRNIIIGSGDSERNRKRNMGKDNSERNTESVNNNTNSGYENNYINIGYGSSYSNTEKMNSKGNTENGNLERHRRNRNNDRTTRSENSYTGYGNIRRSARYVQHGIVSYGPRHCGTIGQPGVYTRVAYYMDWILDNIQE